MGFEIVEVVGFTFDSFVKSIKICHSERGTSEESQPIIDEILRRFTSLRITLD
jgi:hypothetical protein